MSRLAGGAAYQGFPLSSTQAVHGRLTSWGFGVDEAWLRYPLEVFSWKTALQAGWFRWRSHADAALAGEYLTRWKDYPGPQARPEAAWEAQDSLTSILTGLRFSLDSPHGRLRQEALVLLDTTSFGPGLSLLLSLNIAPLPGIEAGFALEQDRFWEPEPPYALSPVRNNTYGDSLVDRGPFIEVDTPTITRYVIDARSVSARLTVDPVMLLRGRPLPDRGGRIYFEAAWLGWENVPSLFGNRMQRLHVTAGLHLPTFAWLDVLRLQAELWPEPQSRTFYATWSPLAVPSPSAGDSSGFSMPAQVAPSRGWSCQLYLSRSLLSWLDVQAWAQLARTRIFVNQDYLPRLGPVQYESPYGTAFEVRIAARL
jgi:hypothetical protein